VVFETIRVIASRPCLVILMVLAVAGPAAAQAPPATTDAAAIERRLVEATRATPDSFAAHRALAEFYLAARQLPQAIVALERARGLAPADYPNGYDLAVAYLHTKRLDAAREQVRRMLAAKETAELDNLLGDIDVEAGDRRAAAVGYQLAARLQPTEDHLYDWGDNLLHLGAHGDAAEVFAAGVRRFPMSSRLHLGLGIAQYARGQHEDAVRSFCRAADIDPADERPYGFLGELYGVSPELSGEITRRLARFVEQYPDRASGHFLYAMNLWKGDGEVDLTRVEALLRRAVALDASHARARLQLGILLSDQRRWRDAIPELQRAVALAPESPQGHFRLAHAYRRNGQAALADEELAIFERLKAREPAAAAPPMPE
jgi:tetratricopeptide (TPR) repeat protein